MITSPKYLLNPLFSFPIENENKELSQKCSISFERLLPFTFYFKKVFNFYSYSVKHISQLERLMCMNPVGATRQVGLHHATMDGYRPPLRKRAFYSDISLSPYSLTYS